MTMLFSLIMCYCLLTHTHAVYRKKEIRREYYTYRISTKTITKFTHPVKNNIQSSTLLHYLYFDVTEKN